MTAIWWIRRDMRLHDSPALTAALEAGTAIPVFVLDDGALRSRYHRNASHRRAFMLAGLAALDAGLRQRGSRLVVREGHPSRELAAVGAQARARAVIALEDATPYSARRDAEVARELPLTLLPGAGIRPLGAVARANGAPYAVFGAFRRAWLSLPPPEPSDLLPAPGRLPPVPAEATSVPLPASDALPGFPTGEDEALARLERFAVLPEAPIHRYATARDLPGTDGTSALSPYLRFGMLSPRLAAVRAIAAIESHSAAERSGAERWLDELIWREFYLDVLHRRPDVLRLEFNDRLRGIAWRNDPAEIEAWQSGRTGYPMVDAGMRQLRETGWMHNRARMIAASFLVKNLLCDWRIGEQWFMDRLIDGDPAANNGGWQWVAGVGTDAAPYFRVFNPVLQGRRFDPSGAYIRRWVPELRGVSDSDIHEPWKNIESDLYHTRIVDMAESRVRALEAYRAALAARPTEHD